MSKDAERRLARASTNRALWAIATNAKPSVFNRGLLLALVLLVLDTLLVSHYQTQTALAVMRYTPPIALFAGVASNLLSIAVPALFWLAAGLGVAASVRGDLQKSLYYLAIVSVTFLIGAFFIDASLLPNLWVVAVALFGCVIIYFVGGWLSDRGSSPELLSLIICLSAIVLVGQQLWESQELRARLATPFLPAERVTIADAQTPESLVAYVLDVDQSGHWTTLLIENGRTILVVSTASIIARSVCVPAPNTFHPQWPLTSVGANEALCV